jgi:hypothetical protein
MGIMKDWLGEHLNNSHEFDNFSGHLVKNYPQVWATLDPGYVSHLLCSKNS